MRTKAQVRSNRSEKASHPQPSNEPAPVPSSPDKLTDEQVRVARESFRKRVHSMSSDQLATLVRDALRHRHGAVILRLMLPVCGLEPIHTGEEALFRLAELADEHADKRSPLEKALCNLRDAEDVLNNSCAQVEALGLASVGLIRDLLEGKFELVRHELIESGLRNIWQGLVDYMGGGASEISSAIKLLSPPADASAPATS